MASARLEWTSVPRWTSPELPAAASYLVCWFGTEAGRRARALLARADPGVPRRMAGFADRWDAAAEAELRRLLGECHTGVRIVLAGPESIVMRSVAVARQLGASDEELVPVAIEATDDAHAAGAAGTTGTTDTTGTEITARSAERLPPAESVRGEYVSGIAERRVFCAPCRLAFDAVAAIGGTTTCPGCAAELIVDYRFSRPHAAYFGWPTGLDLHR
jgi:hypothetical protein